MNAASFRKAADRLASQIEAKRNPAISQQNLTARRARIAANMSGRADAIERVQRLLFAIADCLDTNTLPKSLLDIQSKAQVEAILSWSNYPQASWADDTRASFRKAGITNDTSFQTVKKALLSLVDLKPTEKTAAQKVKELERELIGAKIPGFFPTPRPLADRLVQMAEIQPGMSVLEPSAGTGTIADAVRDVVPDAQIDVCEIQTRLQDILRAKGYFIVNQDFMTCDPSARYDRIVMNPPFEKGQDSEHITHAFHLLKPGGVLVSIMSEGTFFRNDKKAKDFRLWFELFNGVAEKLEAGSFKGKDAFVQTGTSTRVVVMRRK